MCGLHYVRRQAAILMFLKQSPALSDHNAVRAGRQSRMPGSERRAFCEDVGKRSRSCRQFDAAPDLTAVAGAVGSVRIKVVKRSQVNAVWSSKPSRCEEARGLCREGGVLIGAHEGHGGLARLCSPVRPRPNWSFDTDAQRHCATWRAGEHVPCGAMPLRAGQLQRCTAGAA